MRTRSEESETRTVHHPISFIWELDEVQRAERRQQREHVPYPSQMNSCKDNFEDLYLHRHSPTKPEGSTHA